MKTSITVSASITSSNFSRHVSNVINEFIENDCLKAAFSSDMENVCPKPAKTRKTTIYLCREMEKNLKKIKNLAQKLSIPYTVAISRMLDIKEYLVQNNIGIENLTKACQKISINSDAYKPKKISEILLPREECSVTLHIPQDCNSKNQQQITKFYLHDSIVYVPETLEIENFNLEKLRKDFKETYSINHKKAIKVNISKDLLDKLHNLIEQMNNIPNRKKTANLQDVLRYCIQYFKYHNFNFPYKPSVYDVPGSKIDKCFDNPLRNALSLCDEKTILLETCAGACKLLPFYYINAVKAYILNELDDKRRALIERIKSDPLKLIDECQKIVKCYENSKYKDTYFCKPGNLNTIFEYLKINHYSKEAITLLKFCWGTQSLYKRNVGEYFEKFKERFSNVNKLHDYIFNSIITGYNLLDLIETFKDNPDALFIIDLPYYLTDGNYNKNYPDMLFHETLARLLYQVKGKFILHLRINAARDNNSQNNIILDKLLYEFYNKNYNINKFYMYCDNFKKGDLMIKYRYAGTLEAIISNYNFDGCEKISNVLSAYKAKYNI